MRWSHAQKIETQLCYCPYGLLVKLKCACWYKFCLGQFSPEIQLSTDGFNYSVHVSQVLASLIHVIQVQKATKQYYWKQAIVK